MGVVGSWAARVGVRKPLKGGPGSEVHLPALLGSGQHWLHILCSRSLFSISHLWCVLQSALCCICLGSPPRSWDLPVQGPLWDAAVSPPRGVQHRAQNTVRAQKCSQDWTKLNASSEQNLGFLKEAGKEIQLFSVFKMHTGDFVGGPVVKTLPSNASGTGSIPGQWTKIPHVAECGQKLHAHTHTHTHTHTQREALLCSTLWKHNKIKQRVGWSGLPGHCY